MQNLKPFIDSLLSFAQGRLDFKDPPRLFLKQDQENAKDVFGKTAYYDPSEKSITIFTTDRHPKDILRSIAHELVHHCQNLRGDLSPEKCGSMGTDYAQKDDHMREMEREAYEKGNMCFRDWEDGIKVAVQKENKSLKENKKMVKISKKDLKGLITNLLKERTSSINEKEVKWKGEVLDDLTDEGSFKAAFDLARDMQMDYFAYKGKPYHTRKKAKPSAPTVAKNDAAKMSAGDAGKVNKVKGTGAPRAIADLGDDPTLAAVFGRSKFSDDLDSAMPVSDEDFKKTMKGVDKITGQAGQQAGFADTPTGLDADTLAAIDAMPGDNKKSKIAKKPSGKLPENTEQSEDLDEMHCGGKAAKRDNKEIEEGAFDDSHYCIHHGGVEHNGSIAMAEAIQHVAPDVNGFISHYDMKLADGTILENVAAEDIQVTNASLAEEHNPNPTARRNVKHKPYKNKMEENDEIDIEEINRQPHPNAKGPDKKDCAKCKGEGCKHCKGKGTHKMEEAALENPKEADLDKDGKLSPYEKKRGAAIEKSMKDQNESKIQTPEQEQKLYESRFNKRNEEIFDKLKKLWTK